MVGGLSDRGPSQDGGGMKFPEGRGKVNKGDNGEQIWENIDTADPRLND